MHARTPGQRLGLLCIAAALGTWLLTAILWNVAAEPFVYLQRLSSTEKIPKPGDDTDKAYWEDGDGGWRLIDRACIAQERKRIGQNPSLLEQLELEKCDK
ncbi:MAG: hypothetical protein ACREYF_01580, partial [Gammaproteobacteria bacterium]